MLSRRLQAYLAHRHQAALDHCSSCLCDGLRACHSQQGPHRHGHCQLLAGHFPGGQLRLDEGITPVHHSPPVHSGLQTYLGKAPQGVDLTSLAMLPPSLPTLCSSWTGAGPRGTWDWVNWAQASPPLHASALHGAVSPYSPHTPDALPSPGAFTGSHQRLAPPEATRHLCFPPV